MNIFIYLTIQSAIIAGKQVTTFNGTIPGPEIRGAFGDTLNAFVTNHLAVPTAVHWHGMYQRKTPFYDGMPGVTQCLILPGSSMWYNFTLEPAGTYWYHGHFNLQYSDGLYGPLIVTRPNDPDTPAKTVMMADWYHSSIQAVFNAYLQPNVAAMVNPDALMVNGALSTTQTLSDTSGPIIVRFINSGSYSIWNISVTGSVIEVDGTAVNPMPITRFMLAVAQRVVVLVTASQTVTISSTQDSFVNENVYPTMLVTQLIIGLPGMRVMWAPPTYTPMDFNMWFAQAVAPDPMPEANVFMNWTAWFDIPASGLYTPVVNGYTFPMMQIEYNNPPLIMATGIPYTETQGITRIPLGSVVEVRVEMMETSLHPWHLHGHGFWISDASFFTDEQRAQVRASWVRRDTIEIPRLGWVKIVFEADHAGYWNAHCHIDFHAMTGLASVFHVTDGSITPSPVQNIDMCGNQPPYHYEPSLADKVTAKDWILLIAMVAAVILTRE